MALNSNPLLIPPIIPSVSPIGTNPANQMGNAQAAQTAALEQYLRPVPMPAYIVQNPNCCTQNTGCGCGM